MCVLSQIKGPCGHSISLAVPPDMDIEVPKEGLYKSPQYSETYCPFSGFSCKDPTLIFLSFSLRTGSRTQTSLEYPLAFHKPSPDHSPPRPCLCCTPLIRCQLHERLHCTSLVPGVRSPVDKRGHVLREGVPPW